MLATRNFFTSAYRLLEIYHPPNQSFFTKLINMTIKFLSRYVSTNHCFFNIYEKSKLIRRTTEISSDRFLSILEGGPETPMFIFSIYDFPINPKTYLMVIPSKIQWLRISVREENTYQANNTVVYTQINV